MKVDVLDHGYVELIETWGSGKAGVGCNGDDPQLEAAWDYEIGIIEAARQSTQKGFEGWGPEKCDCGAPMPHLSGKDYHMPDCASIEHPGDQKLLKYLSDHQHNTPFEFAGMVIEVQAPIFVFREWHRHRSQSYNEASARYAPLPDLNYVPSVERLLQGAGANKQAAAVAGSVPLDHALALMFQADLMESYIDAEEKYKNALRIGVPKELARILLPVGRYSKMRASANLRQWLMFLTLRLNPAAQWEIRQYAQAVDSLIEEKFPQTWALFHGHRRTSGT